MEAVYAIAIAVAFIFGMAARTLKLPPLVGFLAAGFAVNFAVFESGWMHRGDGISFIDVLADLGVTLLLFTIGLKLKVKDLLAKEVWGSASLHMVATTIIMALGVNAMTVFGLSQLAGIDFTTALLIGFALSFSSTVFAIKVLDEQGESSSLHARVAIGVLIIQDIAAVIFMAASKGEPPSIFALGLFLLYPARPLLRSLLNRCGHGELLILFGMMLAFLGYQLFEAVGVKGDFGALILGMLIAPYKRADELYKTLIGFKDLMLVSFFLSIGLSGTPDASHLGMAALLLVFLPVKMVAYFFILCRFRLRIRTALLTTLLLSNFSEFGLIVAGVAVKSGWLTNDWLVILALSVSMTFLIASPLNAYGKKLYEILRERLMRFQRSKRLKGDDVICAEGVEIAIFGMGRVGREAYDAMAAKYGADKVIGVDFDMRVVEKHCREGRNVIQGDSTDIDYWERARPNKFMKIVMLAMPNVQENVAGAKMIRSRGFKGCVAATALFDDDAEHLREAGVNTVYNIYKQAGEAFAGYVCEIEHDEVPEVLEEGSGI
ncbi:cation:proton antiporter family protein [Persicirhabdus sediminis]|uniref:Cation:proton antiporter n=1 Tax=Persicirhabdus sediminis TaxID=454144 RepID=A0A8J7MEZ5_9BACT|nr:cation:proton antiporter family protein [Persicirhabdus sediminis]MBK1791446.1 cation:proton antiporter [Persicirhabdus sediminis]